MERERDRRGAVAREMIILCANVSFRLPLTLVSREEHIRIVLDCGLFVF